MAQQHRTFFLLPAALAFLAAVAVANRPGTVGPDIGDALDSLSADLADVERGARRGLLGGGSKPVSFAGEAHARFIVSDYHDVPTWMRHDRFETRNSNLGVRLAMVAAPHRNLRLWSRIAFNHAFRGNMPGSPALVRDTAAAPAPPAIPPALGQDGWTRVTQTGDEAEWSSNILYEDMAAGVVGRLGPAVFNARMGSVLWIEQSPLTVWKAQNRFFAWEYLPYELEQSTAMFYDYATVRGERSGRAAWNRKAFQGMQLEFTELPGNFYLNLLRGHFEGYHKAAPWLIRPDNNTALQFTDRDRTGLERHYSDKGIGIGDNYRWVNLLRLARSNLPLGMTVGINHMGWDVDEDWAKQFHDFGSVSNWGDNDHFPFHARWIRNGQELYMNNYYLEPSVWSVDARAEIPGGWRWHVDVAIANVDSVWYKVSSSQDYTVERHTSNLQRRDSARAALAACVACTRADSTLLNNIVTNTQADISRFHSIYGHQADNSLHVDLYEVMGRTSTGWVPAVFGQVARPLGGLDLTLAMIYAPKDFHSGGSFVNPIDGIFPFEASLTKPGKFAWMDNGTPYASNMTGANLAIRLPVPRGQARFSTGFHSQLEEGSDLVYVPWRLIGSRFKATLNSSYTQFDGVGLLDDFHRGYADGDDASLTPAQNRMIRRLGNEFFMSSNESHPVDSFMMRRNPYAPAVGQSGGIRSDFYGAWEMFGAYTMRRSDSVIDPTSGRSAFMDDTLALRQMFRNGILPQSRKVTQNISIDLSYDVARLWGGDQAVFLAGYGSLNSVSRDISPMFGLEGGDNVLLAGHIIRLEPVFQLDPKFYIVGVWGQEVWKSDYGVACIDPATGMHPISDGRCIPGGSQFAWRNLRHAPIDYTDQMLGLGFDWDIAPRTRFNFRYTRLSREDRGISVETPAAAGRNDFDGWIMNTELKTWF